MSSNNVNKLGFFPAPALLFWSIATSTVLILISSPRETTGLEIWNDLRIRFDPLDHVHNGFFRLPRSLSNATASGWIIRNPGHGHDGCTNGGQFNGFQAQNPTDKHNSIFLLYDVGGIVAGIQMLLPHNEILVNNSYHHSEVPMFQNLTVDGEEYFVLTAYFVQPDLICTTGRKLEDLELETASGVWLQNGPTPYHLILIPTDRQEASGQGWTNNNCIVGMGFHNYYRVDTWDSTNCTHNSPVFLLYNTESVLVGFGFSAIGRGSSPLFEYARTSLIPGTWGDNGPQCLYTVTESPGRTGLHIYLVDFPWTIPCK